MFLIRQCRSWRLLRRQHAGQVLGALGSCACVVALQLVLSAAPASAEPWCVPDFHQPCSITPPLPAAAQEMIDQEERDLSCAELQAIDNAPPPPDAGQPLCNTAASSANTAWAYTSAVNEAISVEEELPPPDLGPSVEGPTDQITGAVPCEAYERTSDPTDLATPSIPSCAADGFVCTFTPKMVYRSGTAFYYLNATAVNKCKGNDVYSQELHTCVARLAPHAINYESTRNYAPIDCQDAGRGGVGVLVGRDKVQCPGTDWYRVYAVGFVTDIHGQVLRNSGFGPVVHIHCPAPSASCTAVSC